MLIKFSLNCDHSNDKYVYSDNIRNGIALIKEHGFIEGCFLDEQGNPVSFLTGYIFPKNIVLFELDKRREHYFKYVLLKDKSKAWGKYQSVVDGHFLEYGKAFLKFTTILKQKDYATFPKLINDAKQSLPSPLVGTYFEIGGSREVYLDEIAAYDDPQIRFPVFSNIKKN